MKKTLVTLLFATSLFACEDATKAVDKAQAAANAAIDSMQEKVGDIDLSQFGAAADSAKVLTKEIQKALDVDLSDTTALEDIQDNIANAYSCLVEATSESNVDKFVNKVLETISDEQKKSFIEQSIEKAEKAKNCVM